jgi:hypothetical protein
MWYKKLGLVNFRLHLVRISRRDLNDRLFHRTSHGRTDHNRRDFGARPD